MFITNFSKSIDQRHVCGEVRLCPIASVHGLWKPIGAREGRQIYLVWED